MKKFGRPIFLAICFSHFDLHLPLTLRWYFLSVVPASLMATQMYSPLLCGVREAITNSAPSSKTETPGSCPVSSLPLCNHLMVGLGVPK